MYRTNLRKVGGSVMLAVPPAFLDQLHLRAGVAVGVAVDGNRLIVESQQRPHFTLKELLSQCDASAELTPEDREWIDGKPVGDELL